MSRPRPPAPALLVCGLLLGERAQPDKLLAALTERFGELELLSEDHPFDQTDYYQDELGSNIKRRIAIFSRPVEQGELARIKLETNAIEERFSSESGRSVNIDPGFLTLGSLILATGKPAFHRPYLGQGIYADLTLIYQQGEYRPLAWTYPDYREQWLRALLSAGRAKLPRERGDK